MIIRAETPDDEDAIHSVTKAAFTTVSHTRGMEAQIVRQLRKDGDLRLSIVAEGNGKIVGHAAFSPIAIGGRHDDWFGQNLNRDEYQSGLLSGVKRSSTKIEPMSANDPSGPWVGVTTGWLRCKRLSITRRCTQTGN